MKTISAIAIGLLILAPVVWSQTNSPVAGRFRQLDTDGDGRLSEDESRGQTISRGQSGSILNGRRNHVRITGFLPVFRARIGNPSRL